MGRFLTRDTWEGDHTQPLSLNRWIYGLDNPSRYTDPSGHCRPRFEDPACWILLDRIESDYPFVDLQTDLDYTHNSFWTVPELLLIDGDLGRLDDAATVDLNQIFSANEIRLKRISSYARKGVEACGNYDNGAINLTNEYITNRFGCDGTLEHEIAHLWDTRDGLSWDFVDYVGGFSVELWGHTIWYYPGPEKPAGPTRIEDFAASFSDYIRMSTNIGISATAIERDKSRWRFIESLLTTGTVPKSTSGKSCSGFAYLFTGNAKVSR